MLLLHGSPYRYLLTLISSSSLISEKTSVKFYEIIGTLRDNSKRTHIIVDEGFSVALSPLLVQESPFSLTVPRRRESLHGKAAGMEFSFIGDSS